MDRSLDQSWKKNVVMAKNEFFALISSFFRAIGVIFPYFFGIGTHRKVMTEEYPDPVSSRTEADLPAKTRGRLTNDMSLCTGCGDCVESCPAQCIELSAEESPDPDKKWVSKFNIDYSRCLFCGLCTDVCEPKSITHTKVFVPASRQMASFVERFGRGDISPDQKEKWARMKEQERTW